MIFRPFLSLLIALLLWAPALPVLAAISYVGGQTGGFNGTLSSTTINYALTGGSDATPQAGDIAIVTYCTVANSNDALTITDETPTNYTQFGTELYANDSNDANIRTAYKVMGGTPDTAFVLGPTGETSDSGLYVAHVFRGQHATPLEQAVIEGTVLNTHIVDLGAVTPTTAGAVIYVPGCGTAGSEDNGAVYTSSDLTAFLSTYNQNAGGGWDGMIGAGYFDWTSGPFDASAWGGGGADSLSDSWGAKYIVLAPAAAPAGSTCRGALMLMGVGGC